MSLDDHEDEVKIVNISDKTAEVIDDKSRGASNKVVIILVFVIMFGVILVGGIYFYKNKVDPPSHNKETLKRVEKIFFSFFQILPNFCFSFKVSPKEHHQSIIHPYIEMMDLKALILATTLKIPLDPRPIYWDNAENCSLTHWLLGGVSEV